MEYFLPRRKSQWSSKIKIDRIIIPEHLYQKMYGYTYAAKGEISGLGKVEIKGEDIYVKDIIITKQETSVAGTTLNSKALAGFIVELAQRGENLENWKLWWHTHNDFGVSWSHTDDWSNERLVWALPDKEKTSSTP